MTKNVKEYRINNEKYVARGAGWLRDVCRPSLLDMVSTIVRKHLVMYRFSGDIIFYGGLFLWKKQRKQEHW